MSEPNALIEVFSITILGMILLNCAFEKHKSRQDFAFVAMLTANLAALITELFVIIFKGVTGIDNILAVLTCSSCLCGYALAFFFSAYVYACIDAQRKISTVPIKAAFVLGILCTAYTIIGWYAETLYYVRNGEFYMTPHYPFALLYDGIGMAFAIFLLIRYHRFISPSDCVALVTFPTAVLAALIFQYVVLRKTSQIYVLTTLSLFIIYLMIQKDRVRKIAQQKEELEQMRTQLMLSQIQPHFIFNSLSCIRRLVSKDQQAAIEAIEEFSLYLRKNLDSMNSTQPVPFRRELEHTKEYLYMEHLRFGDRLHVSYQIECDDFVLPVLTMQPIVENAVKHGVLEKFEGGTIWISTWETDDAFLIRVSDNGVGFNPHTVNMDGKQHVGIANVRYRLEALCGGTLQIESQPGVGTHVTIRLPKTYKE